MSSGESLSPEDMQYILDRVSASERERLAVLFKSAPSVYGLEPEPVPRTYAMAVGHRVDFRYSGAGRVLSGSLYVVGPKREAEFAVRRFYADAMVDQIVRIKHKLVFPQ